MKKRIAFALVAVLLVIGYLAQPESGPPAGDEAPAAAKSMKIVVKLHPLEQPDGLCEDVFGRDADGKGWVYSNLHPFVLGRSARSL